MYALNRHRQYLNKSNIGTYSIIYLLQYIKANKSSYCTYLKSRQRNFARVSCSSDFIAVGTIGTQFRSHIQLHHSPCTLWCTSKTEYIQVVFMRFRTALTYCVFVCFCIALRCIDIYSMPVCRYSLYPSYRSIHARVY